MAAASERPEQALAAGKLGDRRLRARHLGDRVEAVGVVAERHRVRIGVVADPVSFTGGAFGLLTPGRRGELLPHEKEGRLDVVASQEIQHLSRRLGRAIVESERHVRHPYQPVPTIAALSYAASRKKS